MVFQDSDQAVLEATADDTADEQLVELVNTFGNLVVSYGASLRRMAGRKPRSIKDADIQRFADETGQQWVGIRARAKLICSIQAKTQRGRAAKLAAFDVFAEHLGTPRGELVELDLARSFVADLQAVPDYRLASGERVH